MSTTSSYRFAGFWTRYFASLIDQLLVLVVVLPVYVAFVANHQSESASWTPPDVPIQVLLIYGLPAILIVGFWVAKQATPGKMAIHARLVDKVTGEKPALWQFALRYVGYFISMLPFGLGYLWMVWDKSHQTWHDKLARTVVIQPVEYRARRRLLIPVANTFGVFVGVLIAAVALLSGASRLGYLPPSQVVTGAQLSSFNVGKLKDHTLVSEDEQIVYFYSGGVWSVTEDGNIITDKHVISYWKDNGRIVKQQLGFSEIDDIAVQYGDSWLDKTVVVVFSDDLQLELWLPVTDDGVDHRFVDALVSRWHPRTAQDGWL